MSSSRDYIIIRAPVKNTEGKQPFPYPRSHFLPRRQRKISEPLGFLGCFPSKAPQHSSLETL